MLVVKDDKTIYKSLFSPMEKYNEVSLHNIKHNMNDYSLTKLRKISHVLINSLCELTIEKNSHQEKVESLESENISLTIQISKLGEHSQKLKYENMKILEKL